MPSWIVMAYTLLIPQRLIAVGTVAILLVAHFGLVFVSCGALWIALIACAYSPDETASRPDAVASVKPIRDRITGTVRGCVRPNHRAQPQSISAGTPP